MRAVLFQGAALKRCASESTEAELVNAARQELHRELRWDTDDDGSLVFRGRLPAEDGARLVQAIQAAGSGVPAGTPAGQRAADGLVVLADAYLGDPSGRDVSC